MAIGTDWSTTSYSQLFVTQPIYVDLSPKPVNKNSKSSSSKTTQTPPQAISWTLNNRLLSVYRPEDCLLIRVYNQTRYSPHQLLGETFIALDELMKTSKTGASTFQGFSENLPLVLPNAQLGELLMANYNIEPSLLVKFNML